MSTLYYECVCGVSHPWTSVQVRECLARCVNTSNNADKYWRMVEVKTACETRHITHHGRWTDGWRDRGSWTAVGSLSEASHKFSEKMVGDYYGADINGAPHPPGRWHDLPLVENGGPRDFGQQTGRIVLSQVGLIAPSSMKPATGKRPISGAPLKSPTPVATPTPSGPANDPIEVLHQRANTLALQLATTELTANLAIERAELMAEVATMQSRLDQIESALEMATALLAAKQ